jgi:NAD(P)H-dependent flavin oxidoreductase YrpB (nitropropane dioxygenase family)
MIRTPVCDLLQMQHPIALGGMGSIQAPALVSAVSSAGGLGAMGCHYLTAEQIRAGAAAIRERTNKPFALNFLVFDANGDPLPRRWRCTRPSSRWPGRRDRDPSDTLLGPMPPAAGDVHDRRGR